MKFSIYAIAATTLILSACGSDSSSSNATTTPDINKTVEKTKKKIPTCKKDGNTVLIPTAKKAKETTCTYNGWNATCDGSRVTLEKNGGTFNAKKITLNSITYTCE